MGEGVILNQRVAEPNDAIASHTLSLTAEERTRSRYWFETDDGLRVAVQLQRGSVLHDGDVLRSQTHDILVRIQAKPEPIYTVTASQPLDLIRAAYHLGNRHVPLEVTQTYLRLSPDPVLRDMLERLGLTVTDDVAPLQPESGAYAH
jgi:urease accessory protein